MHCLSTPIAAARIDAENRLIDANDAFLAMVGLTRETVDAGRLPHDRLSTGEGQTAAHDEPFEREYLREDGRPLRVLCTRHLCDDGIAIEYMMDITDRKNAEEAHRCNEQRLQVALEVGQLGMWDWDLESGAVDWSAGLYRLLGYEVGELKPSFEAWAARLHPEDRSETISALEAARDQERDFAHEFRILDAAGTVCWCSSRGHFFYDEQDRPVRMIGVLEEISERVEAARTLRESEERLRQFGEASSDTLWIVDAKTMRMEYLSPAFERMWQQSSDTVLADLGRWRDRIHPDDLPKITASMPRLLAGDQHSAEYRLILDDGSIRWIYDTGFAIRDENGAVSRVAGIAQDVTRRRTMEDALRADEERLAAIFAQAPIGLAELTLDGRYVTVNDHFSAMLGYSRAELERKTIADVIRPDDVERSMAAIRKVIAHDRPGQIDKALVAADGRHVPVTCIASRLDDERGQPWRVLIVTIDLSDRMTWEQAVQRNEARLQSLIEGIPQLVWRALDGGSWTWASPQWTQVTGQSSAASKGMGWLAMLHPDDIDDALGAWVDAEANHGFEVEYRLQNVIEGRYRWFQTRATPVFNTQGDIAEWLGTSTDIDHLRRLQQEQEVMVAELQHRTRNLLAMVRSIAGQTMASAETLDSFREQFNARLSALSRVQGLLSRSDQEPITIRALVSMELDALGADLDDPRISLVGPDVVLHSAVVQTLSLAMHELATNARKYGALTAPNGHLDVSWTLHDEADGVHLFLQWKEINVIRNDKKRPARRGYGRELIERALPYTLGARTDYRLGDGELCCTIDLPLGYGTQDGPP